jgi:hypothetical protein
VTRPARLREWGDLGRLSTAARPVSKGYNGTSNPARIVIALVLLAHGIGHSMGLLQVFKVASVNPNWHEDSWILSGLVGTTATQAAGVVLWTLAIVGFAGAAGAVVGWVPAGWWQPLAILSAVASIAGLLFFPIAFPAFSTIGAFVVDAAVLVAVLWSRWTPEDLAV